MNRICSANGVKLVLHSIWKCYLNHGFLTLPQHLSIPKNTKCNDLRIISIYSTSFNLICNTKWHLFTSLYTLHKTTHTKQCKKQDHIIQITQAVLYWPFFKANKEILQFTQFYHWCIFIWLKILISTTANVQICISYRNIPGSEEGGREGYQEIEHRNSNILDRCSTTWSIYLVPAIVILFL